MHQYIIYLIHPFIMYISKFRILTNQLQCFVINGVNSIGNRFITLKLKNTTIQTPQHEIGIMQMKYSIERQYVINDLFTLRKKK